MAFKNYLRSIDDTQFDEDAASAASSGGAFRDWVSGANVTPHPAAGGQYRLCQ